MTGPDLVRVRLEVMIDAGTMSDDEIRALKEAISCLDFAGLIGITQEGSDDRPFLEGGFNPTKLLVKDAYTDWREESLS